jgi:hypothetical protein
VDGRTSLLDEVAAASAELRKFVGKAVGALLAEPRFLDALPGYLLDVVRLSLPRNGSGSGPGRPF